jgi:uncharacterized membrane protein/GNAT superfamily N-acetyltransferase
VITVRRATNADVPALVRLINTTYHVEDFFLHGDRTSEADVRERMARPGGTFLVVGDGANLAGAVFVEISGDRGFFAMLSVDPGRQKQGLGRVLVTAVEDHCRAGGCRFLDLDIVNLREELPAFYDKFGFTPTGTAPFHTPARLKRPAHLVMLTKALLVTLLVVSAACRNGSPPAPVPAPVAEAPPAAGATWDPWNEAKLRGIEFRAVGNEPGWYLEIDNERWMRLLYAYGERMATVPPPKPRVAGDITTFESSGDGHAIKADVTPGPCTDGMSDQSYPLNVVVTVDGSQLRGCGRWLTVAP